jgi:glutamate dehydrogenase (NAD(P)+)
MGLYGITPGMKGKTFIIQGFGNVGTWAARYINEYGGIIIGISEHDGSVFNKNGLDVEDLINYKTAHKGLKGYDKAEFHQDDSIIFNECDVFIPAAFEQT